MERSENGMFSLYLRLYPGRYEVIICPFTPIIYMLTSPDSFQMCSRLSLSLMVFGRMIRCDPLCTTMGMKTTFWLSL